MKLNLVADYDVCGKRFAAAWSIHSSWNLVELKELTALSFPTTDGGFVSIAPTFLAMCKSGRKAKEVEKLWRSDYGKQGRLYNFDPIDRNAVIKESEAKA